MKRIMSLIVLLTVIFASVANDFTITPIGRVRHTAVSGSPAILEYAFKLQNNTPIPLYLNSSRTEGALPAVALDDKETTCPFYAKGSTMPVPVKGSCQLVYTSQVPSLPAGVSQQTYLNQLSVLSQMGLSVTYPGFGVTVSRTLPTPTWRIILMVCPIPILFTVFYT